MVLNSIQLQEIAARIEPIIHVAGDILMSAFGTTQLNTEYKKDNGMVTQVDRAVEHFLIDRLSRIVPQAAFCAEESGATGGSDYCWVIDPLDGTTNFARGLPYFCISVALTYQDQPVIGVVYQPLLREYFCAVRGEHAKLNGRDIRVTGSTTVASSMIVLAIPSAKSESFGTLMNNVMTRASEYYSLRYCGSIALDLAYVACGRIDGVVWGSGPWWDVAAGSLLVGQAGGLVSDGDGKPICVEYDSLVASGPALHSELLKRSF